jgi:uncharacterized OsmC-like protein
LDGSVLRQVQRPLKARYREDPGAALITLLAEGRLGAEDVTCTVDTGRALVEAGLHPATGGDGTFACSGDMLLQALVACAGVTLRAVATNWGLPVEGGTIRAEGDLDVRGTLGVGGEEAAVGFSAIRLSFDIDSTASREELDKLIDATERYCVVYQTVARATPVTMALQPAP